MTKTITEKVKNLFRTKTPQSEIYSSKRERRRHSDDYVFLDAKRIDEWYSYRLNLSGAPNSTQASHEGGISGGITTPVAMVTAENRKGISSTYGVVSACLFEEIEDWLREKYPKLKDDSTLPHKTGKTSFECAWFDARINRIFRSSKANEIKFNYKLFDQEYSSTITTVDYVGGRFTPTSRAIELDAPIEVLADISVRTFSASIGGEEPMISKSTEIKPIVIIFKH